MEIGSREWHRIIIDGSRHLGVEIDEGVTVQFSVHASELIRWNRKINLTAITDPRDIAIKHFLDSLAPSKFIPEEVRVLDMGSGGGFPGIPLKILKPSLSVLMKLEHIEALQIRAENLSKDPEFANSFDVIISRALSDLTPFVKNALPLLAPQGKIMAMKGNVDPEELNAVRANTPQDLYSLKIEYYRLPSMNALRSIVIIKNIV
jgi:16S rRNA (guanine527-N7)-methyltransferase